MDQFKKHYSLFLKANSQIQHYASHSHHYWPDVTREAMLKYWDDSAQFVDEKWSHFFSVALPHAQKHIARVLNLTHPENIVFAPNTHEFVYRLLSCFKPQQKIKVLTTDSEFYSFERQVNRLLEEQIIEVVKVKTYPFGTFEERFETEIKKSHYDLIFLSQVFFNSGYSIQNLNKLVQAVSSEQTMFVVDGYHGFMAVPTNLKALEGRIFYISGSYKYAQGGEGACFMTIPYKSSHRPIYTGWFAGFSSLVQKGGEVVYSNDGFRFAGSTMDYSAIYRLNAVLDLFEKENISVDVIHSHVKNLQTLFLKSLDQLQSKFINKNNLLVTEAENRGHFLTFKLSSSEVCEKIYKNLWNLKIQTDRRGDRLRFGFGLYQNQNINWPSVQQIDQL